MTTSRGVNATSFVNYIASQSTYYTGDSLSEDHQTQLKDFLLEGIANPSALLNIEAAVNIVNSLRTRVSADAIDNSYTSDALSEETAKQIVSKFLPDTIIGQFVDHTFYHVSNAQLGIFLSRKFIRIAASTAPTVYLEGVLCGGDGGGSGAIAGDGDKNASYTVVSGAGGDGGASRIYVEDSISTYATTEPVGGEDTGIITAYGGAGGASISKKAGGNPSFATAGNNGTLATPVDIKITVQYDTVIKVCIGAGGGGGAGSAASAGGTTGSKTFTGNSGADGGTFDPFTSAGIPGGVGGSAVTAANEWHSDDGVFSGGGGGGGGFGSNNSYWLYDDVGRCGTLVAGSNSTAYKGGIPSTMSKTAPSSTSSAGGTAGITTDTNCQANGGNGGNAGYLKIYTSSPDPLDNLEEYNALYYKVPITEDL